MANLPLNYIQRALRQPSERSGCHSEPFDKTCRRAQVESLRINSAKILIYPSTYTFEILRPKPQNDVVAQPLKGSLPNEGEL
jgi:hypothetical protein